MDCSSSVRIRFEREVDGEEEGEGLEGWVMLERESVGVTGELKGMTILAWLMKVLRERRDNAVSLQVRE